MCRRTSRGRHSAPRAPQESGATIPGTQRRPGQTDTRARGTIEESASYPTPASNHRLPKGRSIFIIPSAAKRHKGLTPNCPSPLHLEAVERLAAWLALPRIADDPAQPLFPAAKTARGNGRDGFRAKPMTTRTVEKLIGRYVAALVGSPGSL